MTDATPSRRLPSVVWWLSALAGLLALYLFRGLILSVFLAAALAYLLNPVTKWAQGFAIRRDVAVTGLYVVFGAIFLVAVLLFGARLKTEAVNFVNGLPNVDSQIDAIVCSIDDEAIKTFPAVRPFLPEVHPGQPWATRILEKWGESPALLLSPLGALLLSALLVPFFAFFFLKDGKRAMAALMDRLPPRHVETSVAVWCEIDRIIGRYLRGVALDGIAVGVLAALGLWAAGLPYPMLLGAVTGFANMVPLLGPLLGAAAASLVAFTQGLGLTGVGRVLLVFVAIKVLDDTVLQPLTIGRSVHLHPLLVVISIVAGEEAFGLLGMFVAVPLVTALGEAVRLLLERQQTLRERRPSADLDAGPAYVC